MKRVRGHVRNRHGEVDGFQSDLERAISISNGRIGHSKIRVPYIPKPKMYNPDFTYIIGDNEKLLMIEAKGLFTEADRAKSLAVKKNYVDIARLMKVDSVELVFIFQDWDLRINPRNSKGKTYREWCIQHGFRSTNTPYFDDDWFILED